MIIEINGTMNVMHLNHPKIIHSTPVHRKCLPQKWALVPKRLGTAALEGAQSRRSWGDVSFQASSWGDSVGCLLRAILVLPAWSCGDQLGSFNKCISHGPEFIAWIFVAHMSSLALCGHLPKLVIMNRCTSELRPKESPKLSTRRAMCCIQGHHFKPLGFGFAVW